MENFWLKLKKPFYALAPMAGVADSAFRQVCKSYGADVVYSEMASATALAYNPKKTLELLSSSKKEQPYLVQLFGGNPKHFSQAVKLLTDKKRISKLQISNYELPQGIDINFGCPVKKVQKQGAGAVLMDDLKKSSEIIKAVINNTGLPVSIKARSRAGRVSILEFLDNIKDLDVKAIMIHGRTLGQGFSGPVDAGVIRQARDYFSGIILANGGIYSHEDAVNMLKKTRADGLGIARGALGRPWIFKALRTGQSVDRSKKAVLKAALKHAELVFGLKGAAGMLEMRKHLCWYVRGLPGASKLRQELIKVENLEDIRRVFKRNGK